MTLIRSMVLAVCFAGPAVAQQAQKPLEPSPSASDHIEIATAKVEHVFKTEDEGYQFIAYLITYHDKHVIVEDPIASTTCSVGDEVRFTVVRNGLSKTPGCGKKLISFIVGKQHA